MPISRVLLGCGLLLALAASALLLHASPTSAAPVVVRHTLPGHVLPSLKGYRAKQATNKNNQLHLAISLNLRNSDALTSLIAAQDDPTSSLYHQYLTPQQFKEQFGPTQDTVNSVVAYLTGQGLHVTSIAPNNLIVDALGSVATVEQAFGVTLNDYVMNGRTVYASSTNPMVPDTLGSAILTVEGLDNVALYRHAALTDQPAPAPVPTRGYSPTQLRTAYDANALLSHGGTGAGQTTALFELDGYRPSDIATYLSTYKLGKPKYSNVLVDGATNTPADGAIEVELDMEVMSALAPDAKQKIYIGPNTTPGVNDTYNAIVSDDVAKVTSTSWGQCESDAGQAEMIALDNIFLQGAAQGQAFFAAAGDAGAYDCQGDTTDLAVGSPADDPHVVGVGGTSLRLNTNNTYNNESVWSEPAKGEGSGGGISAQFTRPAYQTGRNLTNLNREVPDVSADADPATGYSVYCTVTEALCTTKGWLRVGGTSAAAPLWAAIATDMNGYLVSQKKPTLGSASADLYTLYNHAQTYAPYYDITTGNNLHYAATAGYDVASGIGTPNVWNIALDLLKVQPGGGNGGPIQLLDNATFDRGAASWSESSSGNYEIVTSTRPHAGGASAELCGYLTCRDEISQTVNLPAHSKKVVLNYWAFVSGTSCSDTFYARLRTTSGAIIATPGRLCGTHAGGWTQYTFDVTSALARSAGKSIEVSFDANTTASTAGDFFVDDVALNVTPA